MECARCHKELQYNENVSISMSDHINYEDHRLFHNILVLDSLCEDCAKQIRDFIYGNKDNLL